MASDPLSRISPFSRVEKIATEKFVSGMSRKKTASLVRSIERSTNPIHVMAAINVSAGTAVNVFIIFIFRLGLNLLKLDHPHFADDQVSINLIVVAPFSADQAYGGP